VAKPLAERRPLPQPDAPRRWYRRIPWLAIALTLAVILSSGAAVQPIRDAITGADVAEAYLSRPMGYVAIAPLSGVLDTLVLLSLRQHAALLGGAFVVFALWRVARAMLTPVTWRNHALALAVFVVSIIATYAAGALLPRPMASLQTDNASIVRVDFHSHTDASHDGRMSVEDNRRWHEQTGFNVAYITDHGTVAGAERGIGTNPRTAGEGTTLLQSIEVSWTGEHVSIPNAQRVYSGLLTQNLRDVDPDALRLGSVIPGREPVVIWHHPRDLDRLRAAEGAGAPGIRAIEIVNGAPDKMDDIKPKRDQIVALARQHNLALVTGSDNHGWGRAAPGWTLLRIFNWRAMTPDALATQIEAMIRTTGVGATRVVERRVADGTRMLWASVFTVPARMLTTLSSDERVMWVVWTWLVTGGMWLWRRRRATA
jgi:predicted metal-dependent phosphoesterase TrpH